jgi:FixJ family two-component response regulator
LNAGFGIAESNRAARIEAVLHRLQPWATIPDPFRQSRERPVEMTITSDTDSIVFVVDDDSDVCEGLKALLESVGIRCATFQSTAEFLRSAKYDSANCLILDVRMPGVDGLDFQKKLADALIDIPIIFVTAHGDIPMTVKAMKGGAVEFLTKPFREQDILDAVRAALERDRQQREHGVKVHELQSRYQTLSERERTVMQFVVAGRLNKQTAAEMGVSEVTVKVHRHNLMTKMGAKSVPELVRIADILGIDRAPKEKDIRDLGLGRRKRNQETTSP